MGAILMLLASASFTTMAAILKAVGPDIPLVQLVFLRSILSLPILLIVLVSQGKPLVVKAKKVLVIRSCFGMVAMGCYFYALTHMPLAECIFIGRTQPLLLALLAPVIVQESVPRAAWFAIGTGIVGTAIIMKPAMAWPLAAWFALAAAGAAALAQLLVRRLNRTDHPLAIVFNFLVMTAIMTSFGALPGFVAMSNTQWLLLVGVALFATIGQLLMTFAYRYDKAPAVASASYSSIILSICYGYWFWGELPQPMAWLGGFLIVIGGTLLVKSRWNQTEPA
jgi:drug/metabolite transporter (DMT)-like permease